MRIQIIAALVVLVLASPLQSQTLDRNIYIETIVDAPVTQVWEAWTTKEGLQSFLAPVCNVDLRVDGTLDVYFYPEAPEGQRGAEGLRILSVLPNKMLSFTWNNPPDMPEIRGQLTHVTLKFFSEGPANNRTKLVLIHDGWGDGELWDQAYQYFIRAWRDVVLFRLHHRFDRGPVNWNNPPQNMGRYNIIVH